MRTPIILGLSGFFHDSAACLVCGGEITAAAQEERFTRIKQDSSFPARAVEYVLAEAGITPAEIDHVVFFEKPFLKFDRLLETYLAYAPAGLRSFMMAMPSWLRTKLHVRREIGRALGGRYRKGIVFTGHHESHAASAFYPSPFDEAAILTVDGVGEWDTAAIAHGRGNRIEILKTLRFPHSLGLLYSALTYFCGFKVNSGEYKLMGLAPYGQPRFADVILEKLVDLKEDGSLALDMSYFDFGAGLRMTGRKLETLFGGPPRKPEAMITQREMDLAASIQQVTEEVMLRMARTAQTLTGARTLCLAGGVALNAVANGKLVRSGIFEDIFVQPAPGDAGGALGAALLVHHQLLDQPRVTSGRDGMRGALLGPAFRDDEIRALLDRRGMRYERIAGESELLRVVAAAVAAGQVVGWFHGRMEFGPRALGARSILGDARNAAMQATLNLRVKFRESFRPFAPAVLAEDAVSFFEMDRESPYMLLVAAVRKQLRREFTDEEMRLMADPDLRKRVNVPRSTIPAVTHVDMSARVQTVDEARHGRFYRLLNEFKRQTSCGVMINTSFNVRGEPIVCTPDDAVRCFLATEMDLLVLEDCVLRRADQRVPSADERQQYIAGHPRD
ncbi:MAG: carbamoyltransferase [Opitutaceae bacterium]|nr:carbamoyltransferase [Opitutaceae bacterium]